MRTNRTDVVRDLGSAVHEMTRAELLEQRSPIEGMWFDMRLALKTLQELPAAQRLSIVRRVLQIDAVMGETDHAIRLLDDVEIVLTRGARQ
jgi:hypothetical protein